MPGARFFPDARLNFAENVLRRRTTTPAIIFKPRAATQRTMSWRELRGEVARRSPRRCAPPASSQAIASPPTCRTSPRRSSPCSARASVGAVWSSCSPDFGVQGVLDRFGQIEPRDPDRRRQLRLRRQDVRPAAEDRRRARSSCRRSSGRVIGGATAGRPSSGRTAARRRRTSRCRSIIRSTSCIPPARPACPSASSTAPAAR